jgi:peptide/nickel transport system ATP-binding protein
MNQGAVLTIENLKKHFPLRKGLFAALLKGEQSHLRAVDNISFSLGKKEILGFVGESGCGKSTMSRTILQLLEPTGGKIYFKGTRVDNLSRKQFKPFRRKMQMIFQDPFGSLNPRRTVSEILRQTIKIHNLAKHRVAEDALIVKTLEEVGLNPVEEYWNKYPRLLSGGQLQRVSIGRVLVLQPEFVIADESVSMLDVSVRILKCATSMVFPLFTSPMIWLRHAMFVTVLPSCTWASYWRSGLLRRLSTIRAIPIRGR